MLTDRDYVKQSIEMNLFFLRIVKEHLIFAGAALTPRDAAMVPQLMEQKDRFEALLLQTVTLAKGVLDPRSLAAGDIVTPFTARAETVTQAYTGLPINTGITRQEAELANTAGAAPSPAAVQQVNLLNRQIIGQLESAIRAQKMMLANVLSCRMFTFIYPLMLDHVTREAERYLQHLRTLQSRQSLVDGPVNAAAAEMFWDRIMGEHARFIRGLLDPAEDMLIQRANAFAGEFDALYNAAARAYSQLGLLPGVTRSSMAAVTRIRDFKAQGTQGILECKIRSIILPLLSDHVLREANHYLKELREYKV